MPRTLFDFEDSAEEPTSPPVTQPRPSIDVEDVEVVVAPIQAISNQVSLAVKYRPRRFSEVAGQEAVIKALSGALVAGTLPPQLLMTGPSGTGKTTLARLVAASLLCEVPMTERPDGDSCGKCASCIDITTPGHDHADVVEIDAASHGGKDQILDIAARARLAPIRGRVKVYILDEAHGLSGPGGTALLKLLEEPPGHCVFILASTDPDKILATNRSRCTELPVSRPTDEELVRNLTRVAHAEGWLLDEPCAQAIVESTDITLGVRGTLMSLSRLSGELSKGQLSVEKILELLGGGVDIQKINRAFINFDAMEALGALESLRNSATESRIRSSISDLCHNRLLQAARERDAGALNLWRVRLSIVLDAASGSAGTSLAVVRCADPSLMETKDLAVLLPELTKEAREAGSQLLHAMADVQALSDSLVTSEAGYRKLIEHHQIAIDQAARTTVADSASSKQEVPSVPTPSDQHQSIPTDVTQEVTTPPGNAAAPDNEAWNDLDAYIEQQSNAGQFEEVYTVEPESTPIPQSPVPMPEQAADVTTLSAMRSGRVRPAGGKPDPQKRAVKSSTRTPKAAPSPKASEPTIVQPEVPPMTIKRPEVPDYLADAFDSDDPFDDFLSKTPGPPKRPVGYGKDSGITAFCDVLESKLPGILGEIVELVLTPTPGAMRIDVSEKYNAYLRRPEVNTAFREAAKQLGLELRPRKV